MCGGLTRTGYKVYCHSCTCAHSTVSVVLTGFQCLLPAYRELCDEPTAPCCDVNLSHLLNPWPQLVGHNGGVLAVDVVVDGIVDVDVLALRVGRVRGVWVGCGWGVRSVGGWDVRSVGGVGRV